jgi:hypothetical protein
MTACPRCGDPLERGQDYCLTCGARVRDSFPAPAPGDTPRDWLLRTGIALVVAALGAAVAVAAGGGERGGALVTATGGFATVPERPSLASPAATSSSTLEWPSGEEGWTVVLATLPQREGRRAAVERAREARRRGLPAVGILDSSRFASLHPGYWIVFSGVYTSEAEAVSALPPARRVSGTANVRRIVP